MDQGFLTDPVSLGATVAAALLGVAAAAGYVRQQLNRRLVPVRVPKQQPENRRSPDC